MTLNTAGILAVFRVALRPSLLLPRISIRGAPTLHTYRDFEVASQAHSPWYTLILLLPDIRDLDIKKLKARGVVGLVLDKDNCLTKPKVDGVVPELQDAWPALVRAFGRENVLIVSNSAGTRDDAGLLQAESVSRHLGVPVLLHSVKKPGCAKAVLKYFEAAFQRQEDPKGKGRAREDPYPPGPIVDAIPRADELFAGSVHSQTPGPKRILVIGDRVMTDVVLANTMQRLRHRKTWLGFLSRSTAAYQGAVSPISTIPVLTTTVWKMEGPGSRIMRALEGWTMRRAMRYSIWKRGLDPLADWRDCIKLEESPPIQQAEVASVMTRAKASSERTSADRLKTGAQLLFSPLTGPLQARLARLRSRMERFWQEARLAGYGFRSPDSLHRLRVLRQLVDGQYVRQRIGQKGL